MSEEINTICYYFNNYHVMRYKKFYYLKQLDYMRNRKR